MSLSRAIDRSFRHRPDSNARGIESRADGQRSGGSARRPDGPGNLDLSQAKGLMAACEMAGTASTPSGFASFDERTVSTRRPTEETVLAIPFPLALAEAVHVVAVVIWAQRPGFFLCSRLQVPHPPTPFPNSLAGGAVVEPRLPLRRRTIADFRARPRCTFLD